MQEKKKLISSQIAKKITFKMFWYYFAIYLIILISLLSIIAPLLFRSAMKQATETISILTDEYDGFQAQITETVNYLYLSDELNQLLDIQAAAPSDHNRAKLEQFLSNYCSKTSNLLDATIERPEGDSYSSFYYPDVDKTGLLHENENYNKVFDYSSNSCYIPEDAHNFSVSSHNQTTVHLAFAYSKRITFPNRNYVLTVFQDVTRFFSNYDTLSTTSFNNYLVLDKSGDILHTTSSAYADYFLAEESLHFSQRTGYIRDNSGYYFYNHIPATSWIVAAHASYWDLFRDALLIIGIITLLYLISPCLYVVFLIPTTSRQLSPLKDLSNTMDSYSTGDTILPNIQTGDEIEDLSNTFHQMVGKINEQVKDIRAHEHENAVVNYKLLATQIDPHFVYNTMNIINIMARQNNTDAIIEINSALIKILRERLSSKLSIYDTISHEVDTLMQYNLIMDYRYQNQILIHIDVDEALSDVMIPKNILQPLVENSFYHGFSMKSEIQKGNIDIVIYRIGEELIVEVSDNGSGISPKRLEELRTDSYNIYKDNKPHIGLDNIRQRLAYIYKDESKLEIQSTEHLGTTIIITMPVEIPG